MGGKVAAPPLALRYWKVWDTGRRGKVEQDDEHNRTINHSLTSTYPNHDFLEVVRPSMI